MPATRPKVHLCVSASNSRFIRSDPGAGVLEAYRLREHVWRDGACADLVWT